MLMSFNNMVVQLAGNKQLVLRGARKLRIECTEGVIWMTVEGQTCDFLLAQGEQLRVAYNGLVLIQGLPFGSIRLHQANSRVAICV